MEPDSGDPNFAHGRNIQVRTGSPSGRELLPSEVDPGAANLGLGLEPGHDPQQRLTVELDDPEPVGSGTCISRRGEVDGRVQPDPPGGGQVDRYDVMGTGEGTDRRRGKWRKPLVADQPPSRVMPSSSTRSTDGSIGAIAMPALSHDFGRLLSRVAPVASRRTMVSPTGAVPVASSHAASGRAGEGAHPASGAAQGRTPPDLSP